MLIENINFTDKIVVSNKGFLGKRGFKYFIGYRDTKKIRPLCIFLPKISTFRRDFDKTKVSLF